ncbi:carboxy terminal-processing peptidase [Alkalimonas mucilaginosa]|uniref:Carboxy terminal-processing peptidase n=1 Tax=Alkalimonas mucilaginosa TaxID=3057676 RepID=A0ABU7JDG2_9GAMM|nr:carboxy terminal-processing peptidase [Alkalimonas sp. MEB004]MEE2023525.1 carboxy terminal-processing peptidase [Alkalimonas sp. MEB004]
MRQTFALLMVLVLWQSSVWSTEQEEQQSTELPVLVQESQHATASKRISTLFTRGHYAPVQLDEAFSERVFERFLKSLDYNKTILQQADIERFERHRLQFADALNKGNLTFAFDMFNLSLQRRYERFGFALELLETEFDFEEADHYVYDREEADWAANSAELDELWRQRVKFDTLNLKLTGKTQEEAKELLERRYSNAQKRLLQTNNEDVFQLIMNAYGRSIEAHTSYLSPRNAERFQQDMNLSLEGIGAVLRAEDDYTVIQSLVPGGPADLTQQLKPKDRIIGVAQADEEFVDVIGWRLDDVVELIKGPKGSTVRLQVLSGGSVVSGNTEVVSITRDKIRLEDRAAKGEVFEPLLSELDKRIGVITIPGFYNNLSEDVKKELAKLQEAKVDAIIIDLRGNGGGSLQEATLLTGLFIDRGPVVQIREGSGRISVSQDRDGVSYYDGPLTVLVDRFSASASEIFAAAMQDYGRALVVGEQTFGKGTVQQHRGLGRIYDMFENSLGSVQYTIAKFYRIDGGSTQHRGVIPDIAFPSAIDPEDWGESREENALPWDSIPAARYQQLDSLQPYLPVLLQRHQGRIATNPEFAYLADDIEEYRRQRDEKSVSLVKAERVQQREEREQRQLARTNARLALLGKEPVENLDDLPEILNELDPLLEETVLITADFLQLGRYAKQ